jgi:hypothetical protein
MFKSKIISKPASVRAWLRTETSKAMPSIQADTMLRDMVRELIALEDNDDNGIEDMLEDIKGHVSKIIIDYMHRARIKALKVDTHVSVEGKKVHAILNMSAWGRRATKHLEITA